MAKSLQIECRCLQSEDAASAPLICRTLMTTTDRNQACRPRASRIYKKSLHLCTLHRQKPIETGSTPAVRPRTGGEESLINTSYWSKRVCVFRKGRMLQHLCEHVCVDCVTEWVVYTVYTTCVMYNTNVCDTKFYWASVGAIKMMVDPDEHTQTSTHTMHTKLRCRIFYLKFNVKVCGGFRQGQSNIELRLG